MLFNCVKYPIMILLILFESTSFTHGQPFKPEELAFLPDVCKYTMWGPYRDLFNLDPSAYKGDPRYHKFYEYHQILGPGLKSMHHYCKGLIEFKKFFSCKDEQCRAFELERTVAEFDYVLKNTDSTFRLKPEILVKKGQVQFLLKKNGEAIASVYQAIKLRPDYDQAYLVLSNYFTDQGDIKDACSILREGLEHAPGNGALKNRLQQLEGLVDSLGAKTKDKK